MNAGMLNAKLAFEMPIHRKTYYSLSALPDHQTEGPILLGQR